MDPQEKLIAIGESLKNILIERDDTIEAIIIGMLASQNVLLLGPPGTAKSLTIQMICMHITGGRMFTTLMNKFSTPEDLFGPFSITQMEKDIFERKIEGWLPDAHFAFIDEVFKANAGVLNSLLSVMNERIYYNGNTPINIPLFTLIGASNEVPDSEDSLDALYDRFHIKIKANYIQETAGFAKMLEINYNDFRPELFITIGEIQQLQEQSQKVTIPGMIIEKILILRNTFKTEALGVSDRLWKETLNAIKAHAFMAGRDEVQEKDLEFLKNMLWNDPDDQYKTTDLIYEEVNPDKQEALRLVDVAKDVLSKMKKNSTSKDRLSEAIGAASKVKDLRKSFALIKRRRAKYAEDVSDLEIFERQLAEIANELVVEIGYDGGDGDIGLNFNSEGPNKKGR